MFSYATSILQKFPKLNHNIDRAKNATRINASNEYIFLTFVSLIIIFCCLFRKIVVLFDLLCFVCYQCTSLQLLDSHGNKKDKDEMLFGWILISLILITDKFFANFIKDYYVIHIAALTLLLHPQINCIRTIYNFLFTEFKATNIIKSDITYDEYEVNLIIESININNDTMIEDKLIYCVVIVQPPQGRQHIPLGIEKSAFVTNKLSTHNGKCEFKYPFTLKPLNKLDGTLVIQVKEKDTNYSESNTIAAIEIEINKIEKNNLQLMKQTANNIEVTYKILIKNIMN